MAERGVVPRHRTGKVAGQLTLDRVLELDDG
jgi:hypothetical protein